MKCKNCGKPIKKLTRLIYLKNERTKYDVPGMLIGYSYIGDAQLPQNVGDCRRFTNEQVVQVTYSRSNAGIDSFYTWDGKTYLPCFGYFCTNRCAGQFAQRCVEKGLQP